MPFLGTSLDTNTISLVVGFSIVGMSMTYYFLRKIRIMQAEIDTLKSIIISYYPNERKNLTIKGNVRNSNIGMSGRDTDQGNE